MAELQSSLGQTSQPQNPNKGNQKYQRRVTKIMQKLQDMNINMEQEKASKLMSLDKNISQNDQDL